MGQAYQSVLAGISLGFITPRGIGDYIGRMLIFKHQNKVRVIFPLLLGRISQILPTLIFGLFGVWVLGTNMELHMTMILPGAFLLFTSLVFLLGYSRVKILFLGLVQRLGFYNLKVDTVDQATILRVIVYSFVRYLIFGTQFLIVMMVFKVEANIFIMMAGITWIFFAKSVIPSFSFLSDLGIREFSAILFFESFHIPLAPVLLASLFIWLVNIALPAIVGLVSVQSAKV